MSSLIKKYFFILIESYLAVSIISIAAAFIWPNTLKQLSGLSTLFLQIIFFFSTLKIDLRQVWAAMADYKAMLDVNFYMLAGLPIATYFVAKLLAPDLVVPLVLLAAMPTAMSTPLFVQIVKGNVSYALVLTVTTSLLAPFTIPLVIKFLLGSVVEVDVFSMMLKLMYVIFIPFILSQAYKATFDKKLRLTQFKFKGISIVLLGLLIAGIIANNVAQLKQISVFTLLYYLLVMAIFYIALHLIGYYLVFWKDGVDRMTTAIAATYMNFVLALYLAGKYFNSVEVVIPLIISILPWTILLIPYQKFLKKIHQI